MNFFIHSPRYLHNYSSTFSPIFAVFAHPSSLPSPFLLLLLLFLWLCFTSHCACLQTLLLCCHGDALQMASVKARLGSECTHIHMHWPAYMQSGRRLVAVHFVCSHPTRKLLGCALCPLHTHTYTQQYSIIKPVSQPRRKQSLLYATGMSLILAEVNKCTCIEGIFHRQTADNGGIVVSICSSQYCIQSGPFSLALDPQLMSGVMFHLSDECVYMRENM